MASPLQRSLKHEYELFVEAEIENYKDSIPRSAMLRIGDEAVTNIRGAVQTGFDEVLLCTEVDRIIFKRLRLPAYATWRRRRIKLLAQYRNPEHWGFTLATPIVRAIPSDSDARVLLLGSAVPGAALFLAAHGCQVTAVDEDQDIVDRVMSAASHAGLTSRVSGMVSSLYSWFPDEPLNAVVSNGLAFQNLTAAERDRVIDILKSATLDGGVHLVQTIVAGANALSLDELRAHYDGWDISLGDDQQSFVARKGIQ